MPQAKRKIANLVNSVLQRVGVEVVSRSRLNGTEREAEVLSPEAVEYLSRSHPRLLELQQRYSNHPAARHSMWSKDYLAKELELLHFRRDNAYLYQTRFTSDAAYALTTNYLLEHDELDLLGKLEDDDFFGNYLFNFDDQLLVSRDLLDSVLEINFLNRELGLQSKPTFSVLDIGAGYGRFPHRLIPALPNVERVFCTDAVPESTFISEFYLNFRGLESKARAVPLDEIERVLESHPVDIAINIHSFGECPFASINWWLDLLQREQIKFLFIVANAEGLGSTEADRTNIDYLPAILERGYSLKTKAPKYAARSVQKHGLYPTFYYLFERE